jgi:hypothetical protein
MVAWGKHQRSLLFWSTHFKSPLPVSPKRYRHNYAKTVNPEHKTCVRIIIRCVTGYMAILLQPASLCTRRNGHVLINNSSQDNPSTSGIWVWCYECEANDSPEGPVTIFSIFFFRVILAQCQKLQQFILFFILLRKLKYVECTLAEGVTNLR